MLSPDGTAGYEAVAAGATPTGASVSVTGTLVASKGGRQAVELAADGVTLVGACDAAAYPLQKKRHTREFLRGIAHLRPRTATLGAAARVRSRLAQATHAFFGGAGFQYVTTPIITASDCEGGGEAFQVTTLLGPVYAALAAGGAASPDALAGAECLALHQAAFFADTTDAAIRFGGAVLLRRVVGIAQVADFKGLPDPAARGRAMCAALTVGRAMLVGGAAAFPGGWGDVVKSARAALEEGK